MCSFLVLVALVIFVVPLGLVLDVSAHGSDDHAVVLPPNELGKIPILEYHQIGPKATRWTRSFDEFRDDLTWLYNNDYRAISVKDYLDQTIRIPFGKKPVIFTFDDGGYTQLLMKDGKVDPFTAIGIMDAFLLEHPDFGSAAMFYVNQHPFPMTENTTEALQYLLDTGREIGNHTIDHTNMSLVDGAVATSKLQRLDDYIKGLGFSDVVLDSVAYPFGGVPVGTGYEHLKKKFRLGLLVGADPSYMPYHSSFSAFRVPRIQAIDSEWQRWFKRGARVTTKHPGEIFQPFVSDGDPDVMTAPNLKGLAKDRLREGVVAQTWDGTVPESDEKVSASVAAAAKKALGVVDSGAVSSEKLVVIDDAKDGAKTKKPLQSVRAVYPYAACNDPEAEAFIAYKQQGVLTEDGTVWSWKFVNNLPKKIKYFVTSMKKSEFRRGIYMTAATVRNATGKFLADKLLASGGNTIVFDLNESDAVLKYKKGEQRGVLQDLSANVAEWKSRGIYVVARIVAFKEKRIARVYPGMAVKSAGGGVWRDRAGSTWLDPSNPDVVQYAIDMAKDAADMGVDEVQFDYVRFPTEGNLGSARFGFDQGKVAKWEVIRDFLREARRQTIPLGVKLGADIFGIVGWQPAPNYKTTGQRIECIAPYLDTIYPMGYPSHFGPGFGGHKNPADEPYFFNKETNDNFVKYAEGTGAAIRPWLQAFMYRITIPYNSDYMYQQIRAARDSGSDGFIFWNAGNAYDVVWPAIGR